MKNQKAVGEFQKEVDKIVNSVVKNYQPEKIILFGSGATGKVDEDSDIDLLIIKDTKEQYWDRIKKIIYTCLKDTWYSTDVFVLTPKELEQAIAENRFFLTEEILPKGKVVYEKKKKLKPLAFSSSVKSLVDSS